MKDYDHVRVDKEKPRLMLVCNLGVNAECFTGLSYSSCKFSIRSLLGSPCS